MPWVDLTCAAWSGAEHVPCQSLAASLRAAFAAGWLGDSQPLLRTTSIEASTRRPMCLACVTSGDLWSLGTHLRFSKGYCNRVMIIVPLGCIIRSRRM